MTKIRVLLVGVFLSLTLPADERITIPMYDDSGIDHGLVVTVTPRQTFENSHPSVWRLTYDVWRFGKMSDLDNPFDIKLQFDVGGLCAKKPDQWSSINERRHVTGSPTHGEFDLEESVGCTIEIIKVALISAVRGAGVIAHNEVPPVDLTEQLKKIQAQRDADLARRKGLTAERDARYAKARVEDEEKAAAEKARIRAACTTIYKSTSDKKVGDLLVKEEQQVRACQALGLYPPR